MVTWLEMKRTLYAVLTACGIALMVMAYFLSRSAWFPETVTALILFITGTALLFFGLVTYMCRDDWEIWS